MAETVKMAEGDHVPETFTETKFDRSDRVWTVGKRLGQGGFARVYELVDSETGQKYAGKLVQKSSLTKQSAKDKLRTEIRVHKNLDHPHVVKFVTWFEDGDWFVLVLELCTNRCMKSLLKNRKRLTEPEIRYYLVQMVSALRYLQTQRVIHRDLKPGNIFLDQDMKIKLGDFGLCDQLVYECVRCSLSCGTPNYIAPEVLDVPSHGYHYPVDVWSLGVIIYVWAVGRPAFETSNVRTTYNRIRNAIFYFPEKSHLSQSLKDLIESILKKNPDDRLTLDEIEAHSFLADQSIPDSIPSTATVMEPHF